MTRSRLPAAMVSSASLVRTNVNGQISPRKSSSALPGDDAIGGCDEFDELVINEWPRRQRRVALWRQS